MITFHRPSIALAHQALVHHLYWKHREELTEDGEITWESLEPISVEISEPLTDMIHCKSSFQQQRCDEYAKQLIQGWSGFDYTYHERLFDYPANGRRINQIYRIISKLQTYSETRRAVAITWEPDRDTNEVNVPCLQLLQYLIRDDRLDCFSLFRSNDILSAFGPNAYGLVNLQSYIATQVGVPIGTYTHIVTVPHLYPTRDRSELERWV